LQLSTLGVRLTHPLGKISIVGDGYGVGSVTRSDATMNSKLLANGLSKRTNNLLFKAGIAIEKSAIVQALKAGKLQVYRWPPNYGKYTHREVCQWAEVDPISLPQNWPDSESEIFPDIGLSFRAWRTLKRAGIPVTKAAVGPMRIESCMEFTTGSITKLRGWKSGWVGRQKDQVYKLRDTEDHLPNSLARHWASC